jgi:GNAT superfamily N-acetyltransferase
MKENNLEFRVTVSVMPALAEKINQPMSGYLNELTGRSHHFESGAITVDSHGTFAGGILFEQQGDVLWIDRFWVEQAFRKKGIGTKLVQSAQLVAKEKDCNRIQLNTYFPEALAFFQKQGFEVVAMIPQWKYGLDCHYMRLKVLP